MVATTERHMAFLDLNTNKWIEAKMQSPVIQPITQIIDGKDNYGYFIVYCGELCFFKIKWMDIIPKEICKSYKNKIYKDLIYGFVKESFDGEVPKSILWLFMEYLQYLVERWDTNNVSSKVEINGSIIKGKSGINCFENVYGALDLKEYSQGKVIWKLQVVNVKWKSIGAN